MENTNTFKKIANQCLCRKYDQMYISAQTICQKSCIDDRYIELTFIHKYTLFSTVCTWEYYLPVKKSKKIRMMHGLKALVPMHIHYHQCSPVTSGWRWVESPKLFGPDLFYAILPK